MTLCETNIFNDIENHAASLRQLSFLLICLSKIDPILGFDGGEILTGTSDLSCWKGINAATKLCCISVRLICVLLLLTSFVIKASRLAWVVSPDQAKFGLAPRGIGAEIKNFAY